MTTTPICIRAAARGGKFLGPDAGGAKIWVYNATTGDTYAAQETVSGDSGRNPMMTTPLLRDTPLPVDSTTAAFFVQPDLDRPCLLYIGVEGPLLYRDQASLVISQAWVLPGVGTGRSVDADAGLVIEIPGLCIDVRNFSYDETTSSLTVEAAVMMMCGCKVGTILPGMSTSPWPPSEFDVQLVVGSSGSGAKAYTIAYSGTPSIYQITQILPSRPAWAMITVSQFSMGQSGVCTVFGDAPSARKEPRPVPGWMQGG